MADEAYIDLSPVINAVRVVSDQVSNVQRNVGIAIDNQNIINNNVNVLREFTARELNNVKKQLFEMERSAKLRAALQRALTEIVRVRQELEAKFGTQKLVREYMLGILQATDLGLITKSTISKCTEELMLSAPKYWLAPALIALASWISDNRPLAEKALEEAIKRDPEKTSLLFALISRRVNAGRAQAGKPYDDGATFRWLDLYFEQQDPFKMRTSIISFIDAYSNGVFGEDKNGVCEGHINHWMERLKEKNTNFAEEQKQYWLGLFDSFVVHPNDDRYAALAQLSPQYNEIDQYISRIAAADSQSGIRNYLGEILHTKVDLDKLIEDIDKQLIRLVDDYEEAERPLREEEEYLQLVKDFEGDEARARNLIEAKKAKMRDEDVNFALRLDEAIVNKDADPSARKTALTLLRPYISEAFGHFITARKGDYPETIELAFKEAGDPVGHVGFDWKNQTTNGENRDEMAGEIRKLYADSTKKSLDKISDEAGNKKKKAGTIVAITLCWTIVGLIVGLYMRSQGKKILAKNDADRATINEYFGRKEREKVDLLDKALEARADANNIVETFQAREGSEEINLHDLDVPTVEAAPAAEPIPEEPVEEPAEEPVEEPVEEPAEEPVEESKE